MSELTLTLLRLGFLLALWLFVFGTLSVLRNDLVGPRAPRRARPKRAPRSRSRGAHLVVSLSDGGSRRLDLSDAAVTFGRAADCTVQLDDDYTSNLHARILRGDRGWVIEDCGSTNGTWVDRKRITGPTTLAAGNRIRIGRTEIAVKA